MVEVVDRRWGGVGSEVVLEDADVDCRDPVHFVEQLLARSPKVGVEKQPAHVVAAPRQLQVDCTGTLVRPDP